MAWRNCVQAISATIPQLMLTDENANAFMQALIAAGDNTSAKTAAYNTYVKPLLLNTYCQTNDLVSEKIAGDNTNYISCSVSGGFANFYFYYNNTQQTVPQLSQSKLNNWVCAYVACVDDENQVGYWQGFTVFINNPLNVGSFGGTQPPYSGVYANQVYTILTGNEYHQYTWSSVPAISGKNGILSLATLKANKINDGEPVSNGYASDFSSLPSSSKISVLVAAVMPEDPGNRTGVNVQYRIESLDSGSYTSSKLAIKKNSIPESLADADLSMDIPAQSGTYSVGGLDELTKYYFVIFVADSNGNNATSEPEYITTGEIIAPFREEVVVEKKTGDEEYALVYTWTGKWGKQDDVIAEGFEVSTFDVLLEEESQLVENFEESYVENNWISEAQDAEIQT